MLILTKPKKVKTTGKRFKCIGLEEHHCLHWNDVFEIDEFYDEAVANKEMAEYVDKHQLYLVYKEFYPMYVDKTQFRLLLPTIN